VPIIDIHERPMPYPQSLKVASGVMAQFKAI
jgi:hypothetical protein